MPQFTITLSDAALARLKAIVDRTNADNGLNLTVRDWVILHLKELAIADDLLQAQEAERVKAEEAARQAVLTKRQQLLDSL